MLEFIQFVVNLVAALEAVALFSLLNEWNKINKTMKGYQRDFERIRNEQETERLRYDRNLDSWQRACGNHEKDLIAARGSVIKLVTENTGLKRRVAKLQKGKKNA